MGVTTTETTLPGRIRLRRRAPMLYQRLMRGYINTSPSDHILNLFLRLPFRFYPGIAFPNRPQISDPDKPAGSIEASKFERTELESFSARAVGPDINARNVRATRVVGSLDHAVLPMPPVRGFLEQLPEPWTPNHHILFSERQ